MINIANEWYGSWNGSEPNMENVINKGLPLIIGEFGGYHQGADVDDR